MPPTHGAPSLDSIRRLAQAMDGVGEPTTASLHRRPNPDGPGRRVVTIPAGSVLFHGTSEPFDGPLRPGGYDGVLWFSDSPRIAQLYINAEGSSMSFDPRTLRYPVEDEYGRTVQRAIGLNYDYDRVRWNAYGRPESFWPPSGWADLPSEQDVERLLREGGWEPGRNGGYSARFDGDRLMAPGELLRGRLFVGTVREPLRVWQKSLGEGDLTDVQYHDVGGFAEARASGLDGVIIDDFAQSRARGNVGHLSLGLFGPSAHKLDLREVPAQYHEWGPEEGHGTPAYPDAPAPFLHLARRGPDTRRNPAPGQDQPPVTTTLYALRRRSESGLTVALYARPNDPYTAHVGLLRAERLADDDRLESTCARSVRSLARAARAKPEPPYVVLESDLLAEFRHRGVGAWMYAEAARLAWVQARTSIVADTCTVDGVTSVAAGRVWDGAMLRQVAHVEDRAAIWRSARRSVPPPAGVRLRDYQTRG